MNDIQKSDFFEVGKNDVKRILTPDDKKIEGVYSPSTSLASRTRSRVATSSAYSLLLSAFGLSSQNCINQIVA